MPITDQDRPPRPRAMTVKIAGIPEELRALPQWVVWQYLFRDGKWTKPPFDPKTGSIGNSSDPGKWGTFEQAIQNWQRERRDGIGFTFAKSGGYVGVDLDHCRDPQTGIVAKWAVAIISRVGSYAEFSVSGTGVHILARGKLVTGTGRKRALPQYGDGCAVEAYADGRYFTVSGQQIGDQGIADAQAALDWLCDEFWPPDKALARNGQHKPRSGGCPDDRKLISMAKAASNGAMFQLLWAGDTSRHAGDDSAADLALCNLLAFWAGPDKVRIERLFGQSGLVREKWERQDYRDRTINKALEGRTEFFQWHQDRPPPANGQATSTDSGDAPALPEIVIRVKEAEVGTEAVKALTASPSIFQRSSLLCSIMEECQPKPKRDGIRRPVGTPRIVPMPLPQLRDLLTVYANWRKMVKTTAKERKDGAENEKLVPAHPPEWVVKSVATKGTWEGIRPLEGIIETPTLRSDGSLIDQPGYDEDTGLWFAPKETFPAIPENPTAEQVETALASLFAIVADFPFSDPTGKATWLAAALTALARFAIDGPCPLFLFDANCPGTGKSKLCDTIAILATGRPMARTAYSDDQNEMQKLLVALAIGGDRFILFDNVASGNTIGGAALEQALTTCTIKGRVLGMSKMTQDLPMSTLFFSTGNNLGIRGNTLRRVIPCRLESDMERPEERSGFQFPDLLSYICGHRGRLVSAALTILRGYLAAGKPKADLPPIDYVAWSELIRGAVYWSTGLDPCATRVAMRADDEESVEIKTIVLGWKALCLAKGFTELSVAEAVSEVVQTVSSDPAILAIRELFLMWSRDGKTIVPKTVGCRLRKYKNRNFDGKCLRNKGSDIIRWYIQ